MVIRMCCGALWVRIRLGMTAKLSACGWSGWENVFVLVARLGLSSPAACTFLGSPNRVKTYLHQVWLPSDAVGNRTSNLTRTKVSLFCVSSTSFKSLPAYWHLRRSLTQTANAQGFPILVARGCSQSGYSGWSKFNAIEEKDHPFVMTEAILSQL